MSWSRRAFLRIAGLGAGSLALGLGTWSCGGSSHVEPGDDDPLTPKELDQLVAASVALFEPEDERERQELDATIRWWATGRSSRGPHLKLYRDGLAARGQTGSANAQALKALNDELLDGIYSTAVGWKSLGYTTWPGIPSAPLEYTTRPHGPVRVVLTTPLPELVG